MLAGGPVGDGEAVTRIVGIGSTVACGVAEAAEGAEPRTTRAIAPATTTIASTPAAASASTRRDGREGLTSPSSGAALIDANASAWRARRGGAQRLALTRAPAVCSRLAMFASEVLYAS